MGGFTVSVFPTQDFWAANSLQFSKKCFSQGLSFLISNKSFSYIYLHSYPWHHHSGSPYGVLSWNIILPFDSAHFHSQPLPLLFCLSWWVHKKTEVPSSGLIVLEIISPICTSSNWTPHGTIPWKKIDHWGARAAFCLLIVLSQ